MRAKAVKLLLAVILFAPFSGFTAYAAPSSGEGPQHVTYILLPDGSASISALCTISENTSWTGEFSVQLRGGLNLSMGFKGDVSTWRGYPWNATSLVVKGMLSGGGLLLSSEGCLDPGGLNLDWGNLTSLLPLGDLILSMDLQGGSVTGSITAPMGLPDWELQVEFQGDRSALSLHGEVVVLYGIFTYNGEAYEVNEASLRAALHYTFNSLPGRDEGSLYDLTEGAMEAVSVNYTLEDVVDRAYVEFQVEASGDFLRALGRLLGNEAIYGLLDLTYAYMESAHLDATYVSSLNRTYLTASMRINADLLGELPSVISPRLGGALAPLINALLDSAEALDLTLNYDRGSLEVVAEGSLRPLFEEALNDLKVDAAEHLLGGLEPWERSFLERLWLGASDLELTLRSEGGWVEMGVDGLILGSAADWVGCGVFMVPCLFNLTGSLLRGGVDVVVVGGDNSTHLVYPRTSGDIPPPDETPSPRVMVWRNTTTSNLSPLLFRVEWDEESPRAEGGGDRVAVEGVEVLFNASASIDNLEVSSYLWDFGDGENASGPVVRHAYEEDGDYIVVLRVRDAAGNIGVDTLKVTVLRDSDGDGAPDPEDPDDDNDGWPDPWDPMARAPLLPNLLLPPLALLTLAALWWARRRGP